MTLRLEERLNDLLTEASFDCRLTKTEWIRRSILRSLAQGRRKDTAMYEPVLR
jgi:hypothetical protein